MGCTEMAHCCGHYQRAGLSGVPPSRQLRMALASQREVVQRQLDPAIGRSRMASGSLAFGRERSP